MRKFTAAIAGMVLVLATACVGFEVRHDYDLRTDFRAFKTYDWTQGKTAADRQGRDADPIMIRRVTYHVDRQLAAQGYRLEKSADPDFLVAFSAVYRDHKVHMGTTFGSRFGPFGMATHTGETRTITEGSILLEIFDFKTKQLVWQSVAEGALTGAESPEEADEQVGEAVKRMLEPFPPRADHR